jgi:hypothetical protein
LNDLSEYIKNFGLLTITNRQQQEANNTNQFLTSNSHRTNNLALNNSQHDTRQQHTNRSANQRQTWNIMGIENVLPYYHHHSHHSNVDENNFTIPETTSTTRNRRNNRNQPNSQDRPIFGGTGANNISTNRNNNSNNITPTRRPTNVPRSIGFSINLNEDNMRDAHPSTSNNIENRRGGEGATSLRSNTFVLDHQAQTYNEDDGESDDRATNRIQDNNNRFINESALYNVRRARRAKTPMTFNIMLDEPLEPLTNLFNENNTNEISNLPSSSNSNNRTSPENTTSNTPHSSTETHSLTIQNPKVNYASKNRAKIILGKQGRDNGEFIWPIDVAINQFNQQMLVSDSANHRIQVFMEEGRFFKYFGKQGDFKYSLYTFYELTRGF